MTNETPGSLFDKIILGIEASTLVAIERARQTGTKLILWRNGKIVELTPEELELEKLEKKLGPDNR